MPLFYALPADTAERPKGTVPLYELVSEGGKRRFYSTDRDEAVPGYRAADEPLCLVWANPIRCRF